STIMGTTTASVTTIDITGATGGSPIVCVPVLDLMTPITIEVIEVIEVIDAIGVTSELRILCVVIADENTLSPNAARSNPNSVRRVPGAPD
ncbi:MAG: hypothetical protein O7B25_12520, partial [Gammaproteobacteria bacterium]|nr:hypothetical protein [Gammaproteobacteria bacterium]